MLHDGCDDSVSTELGGNMGYGHRGSISPK